MSIHNIIKRRIYMGLKKIVSKGIVLALTLVGTTAVLPMTNGVSAMGNDKMLNNYVETNEDEYIKQGYYILKSQDEVDKELKSLIDKELKQLKGITRSSVNPNNWKTVYGTKKTVTLKGYAGNQLPGGRKFPTGGGFYFSDSGGPTVSVSVSYSSPYVPVSVSVGLGNSSTSGQFVTVPNKTNYFKLYVSKDVQVQPYIVYQRTNSSSPWKVYYRGKVQTVQRASAYAKKV